MEYKIYYRIKGDVHSFIEKKIIIFVQYVHNTITHFHKMTIHSR